jgi:protein SCO1
MSKPTKIFALSLWTVAVAAMLWVVAVQLWDHDRSADQASAAAIEPQPPADSGQPRIYPITLPTFTLTNQLGHTVTSQDLKGHPFVVDFIFTECQSLCPMMSTRMSALQKILPTQVRLVSFSVDPVHDTPPVLLAYAKRYGADNSRWQFLTGPQKTVFQAVDDMKATVIPATQTSPLRHDIHFWLFDSTGRMRGLYDSRYPGQIASLIKDATFLATGAGPH